MVYATFIQLQQKCAWVLDTVVYILITCKDSIDNIIVRKSNQAKLTTCTLVDPDRCSKYFGHCRRHCLKEEKQIDICFSSSKICCIERLFED
ncbi:beta-defensin 114 [Diceros bicornis minor]|uniref:beta-defensin 114 n=1 Tax=Diceros bicornis minor TaxID=77932 RepID=UPI0026F2E500|nr:beta-defensin 114 [Diceros bicornis minor]